MNNLKLPSLRTVVENISLNTAKLDKIIAESQSRVASYLDIRYPDCQEVIFLLGGKAVKAGRFTADGNRTILNVKSALSKLKQAQNGTISFYETTKLLMVVVLGTFIFQPTHAKLKSKQIDFKGLLQLLKRKHFIGYLELRTSFGLSYLTFFNGEAREGYFANEIDESNERSAVEIIARLIEKSDDKGEINVYESVGEQDLHESQKNVSDDKVNAQVEKSMTDKTLNEKLDIDDEMVDQDIIGLYKELFEIMVTTSKKHLSDPEIDTMFMECLTTATLKHAALFRGAGTNEDGSLLATGLINFEQLLKSKNKLPVNAQEQSFLEGMIELAWLRLLAMQERLPGTSFNKCLQELTTSISTNKQTYENDYTISKFLLSFSRVIDRIQLDQHE